MTRSGDVIQIGEQRFRVTHVDRRRGVLTIERDRRWFRGRYATMACASVSLFPSPRRRALW